MSQQRGIYNFEVDVTGRLIGNAPNLEKIRALFLDGHIIGGDWGPGDEGDFDHGAWHILCHLAGASVAFGGPHGLAWCGITHTRATDTYDATMTLRDNTGVRTIALQSPEATASLAASSCLGFIEGTSLGHISARDVIDETTAFNGWPRQRFDQDVASPEDGGTVWEHWSTTRDLRSSNSLATSVLRAWLNVAAVAGGDFIAAVARGRREHSHPRQLVALVRAGVLTPAEATLDFVPDTIGSVPESLLYEARPADSLAAAELLGFTTGRIRYFMFERRIHRWSSTADVRRDLEM